MVVSRERLPAYPALKLAAELPALARMLAQLTAQLLGGGGSG